MVGVAEKYRPTKLSEFVGNSDQAQEALDIIKQNKSCVLAGTPGIGKTTLANVIANELNLHLVKTNASDERRKDDLGEIERNLKMVPFFPTLTLLDEVDGIKDWSVLVRLLKKCKRPVILTANEKRALPKELFKFCKLIEMKPLTTQQVAIRINQIAEFEGIKPNLALITNDLRESINRVFYGSDSYDKEKSDFDKVDEIFKHKEVYDIKPMWLIDNLTNYYNAFELLEALEVITVYEKVKNPDVLRALPVARSGRATYPNYYRQMVRNRG